MSEVLTGLPVQFAVFDSTNWTEAKVYVSVGTSVL